MKKSIVALGIVLALSGCAAAADETLAAELRSRWKLLQLPNLRRQQPLRRQPSLRQSPPQNPRKPRWRKP